MNSNLEKTPLQPEKMRTVAVRRMKNVVSAADHAAMHEHYSFLPPESNRVDKSSRVDDSNDRKPLNRSQSGNSSWKERMVSKYHEHLFKEFALADLSIPGRIGLRWRTREEVMCGRGERSCGNKRCKYKNHDTDALVTLEVPFSYTEHGELKKELVKLRLCANCRPLLQNSTTKSKKTRNGSSPEKKAELSEDISGKSGDDLKTNKRELKKWKQTYRREKKRRRKSRA